MIKKILVLVLVSTLIFPLGLTAREKRGANLIVEKLDGQLLSGELITIKDRSILLLSESRVDVTVDMKEVSKIIVLKKSKTLAGAGLGFLAGAGLGVMTGLIVDKAMGKADMFWGPEHSALAGGAIGGLAGALGGGMIGAHKSRPAIYVVAGQSPDEINSIQEHLRTICRVFDYD